MESVSRSIARFRVTTPFFRRKIAEFAPWGPELDSWPIHVRFTEYKVAVRQVAVRTVLHTHPHATVTEGEAGEARKPSNKPDVFQKSKAMTRKILTFL
jgi:hypothetical protein